MNKPSVLTDNRRRKLLLELRELRYESPIAVWPSTPEEYQTAFIKLAHQNAILNTVIDAVSVLYLSEVDLAPHTAHLERYIDVMSNLDPEKEG